MTRLISYIAWATICFILAPSKVTAIAYAILLGSIGILVYVGIVILKGISRAWGKGWGKGSPNEHRHVANDVRGLKRCVNCGLSETYWSKWPTCDNSGIATGKSFPTDSRGNLSSDTQVRQREGKR